MGSEIHDFIAELGLTEEVAALEDDEDDEADERRRRVKELAREVAGWSAELNRRLN